mgnify:CR=1 FL=1
MTTAFSQCQTLHDGLGKGTCVHKNTPHRMGPPSICLDIVSEVWEIDVLLLFMKKNILQHLNISIFESLDIVHTDTKLRKFLNN